MNRARLAVALRSLGLGATGFVVAVLGLTAAVHGFCP